MADGLPITGRRQHIGAAGLVILACLLYFPTVQPDISASGNVYLRDVGNAQNALAQWGTLHGSAFPLYSFTGALFVTRLRGVGVAPALAAGLYSSVWAILALVALHAFLMAWLNDRVAAVLAASLLGVGWVFWLHSSIAEVYSLSLFVIIGALWLAVQADQTGRVAYVYGLAICCGLAVSHHRAIALALPAPALIAAPTVLSIVRRRPRVLLECAGLALVSGVMPYLYLLIRAQQGAPWIFGDPSTLAGLRRIMVGESYATLVSWPATLEGWLERLRYAGQIWLDLLTWPAALAGAAGIGWMLLRSSRRYGWAFLLGAAAPLGAAIVIQADLSDAVVEAVPPLVQEIVVFTVCGLAYVLSRLRARSTWTRRAAAVAIAALCAFLIVKNQPVVYDMAHDDTGRRTIQLVQKWIRSARPSSPAAFFALWGGDDWALAYARDVTRELASFDLLPQRADVAEALQQYGRLHTLEWTFNVRGLDWWDRKLGRVFLSSAANKIVAISTRPLVSEADVPSGFAPVPMGESIALRAWPVEAPGPDHAWGLTLYWQAIAPVDRDYSVFVHASDRDRIDTPEAIVAQADSFAPVYGWYPTSRWSPGEIVRDDYRIDVPPGRSAKIISVGLYTQDETGAFQNLGQHTIRLEP